MANKRRRPLKLKVPWSEEPLRICSARVSDAYLNAIDQIKQSGSPYVREDGNDVLVVNFFKNNNKVPDVSRYRIHNMSCCVRYDYRYRICNNRYIIPRCDVSGKELERQLQPPESLQEPQRQERIRNIVLLLESPHEYEYEYIYKWVACFARPFTRPKAPACGVTGDNIDRWLGTVLSRTNTNLIEPGCHVIISNPIQFQTSLHAIHRQPLDGKWSTLRNNVWKTLWRADHITECFRARLTAYNPSLIINACTGDWGCQGKDPKGRVDCFVQRILPNVYRYETYHPARHWKGSDPIRIRRVNPYPEPINTR